MAVLGYRLGPGLTKKIKLTGSKRSTTNTIVESMRLPEYNPSPDNVRALLERADLSQRGAARALLINARTVRYWCAGDVDIPYTAQLALEFIVYLKTNKSA